MKPDAADLSPGLSPTRGEVPVPGRLMGPRKEGSGYQVRSARGLYIQRFLIHLSSFILHTSPSAPRITGSAFHGQ